MAIDRRLNRCLNAVSRRSVGVWIALAAISPFAPTQSTTADDSGLVAQLFPQEAPVSDYHERLAALVGEWHINVAITREPGGHPEIFDGTAVRTLILGGRVLEERTTMSNGDGLSVEAIAQYGYDEVGLEVWMTWVDTTANGLAVFRGHFDLEEDATFLFGTVPHPRAIGRLEREVVTYLLDENRQIFEFTGPVDPSDQTIRTREIVYTRN